MKNSVKVIGWCLVVTLVLSCGKSVEKDFTNPYPTLEYADIEKLGIKIPYLYTCGSSRQLMVYGSNHTANPSDPQIMDIENNLLAFKPDLILYEGDGIATEPTKATTIETYFEMGFVVYLADSLQIKAKNIEPDTKAKFNYLLSKYPKSEVLLATLGLQLTMMQMEQADLDAKYPSLVKIVSSRRVPIK